MAGSVGNLLEWYDFAVFGYFAPFISTQFFPADDPGQLAAPAWYLVVIAAVTFIVTLTVQPHPENRSSAE